MIKNDSGKYILEDSISPYELSECILILEKTNFYPHSGGQFSDTGVVNFRNGSVFNVNDVFHIGGYSFHVGKWINTRDNIVINKNEIVKTEINSHERFSTTMNHTAVHLLNHALR